MTTTAATLFHWDDLEQDHPLARLDRKRIIGEHVMLSHITLHEGCVVGSHQHESEQLACVMSGEVVFGLGTEGTDEHHEVTARGGDVVYLPSNVLHSARAVRESIVLDVFSPPSEVTGVDTVQ